LERRLAELGPLRIVGLNGVVPATAPVAAQPGRDPARYVSSGPPGSDGVALTFHLSGDPAVVTRLLALLHERKVAITAFVVGKWLSANPAFATRLRADGHDIGNHTYNHLSMGRLGRSQTASEIGRGAAVLRERTGDIGRWFRPSGIAVPTPTILTEAGRVGYPVSVGYSIDSLDFEDPGAAAVRANVARDLRGGAVVSLHFGHAGTIEALPGILADLAQRRLRPVTLSELLV